MEERRYAEVNAPEYSALYQDHALNYCAPQLEEGYQLEWVRRSIAAHADLLRRADRPRAGRPNGFIDRIDARCIAGWARSSIDSNL
jgi:hypothetical protein